MGKTKNKKKNKALQQEQRSSTALRKTTLRFPGDRFLAILIFFALLSVVFLGLFRFRQEYHVKKNWKSTQGDVVEYKEVTSKDSFTNLTEWKVRYQYNVANQWYSSEKINLQSDPFFSKEELFHVLPELKAGKQITLWYNPENPQESILCFYYSWFFILGCILIPPSLLLVAILLLDPYSLLFWKRKKAQKS